MNTSFDVTVLALPDHARAWLREQANALGLAEAEYLRKEIIDAAQRHAELKKEMEIGLQAIKRGEFREYTRGTLHELADDIKTRGRERFSKPQENP